MAREASFSQISTHLRKMDGVATIYRSDVRGAVVDMYVQQRERPRGLTDQVLVHRVLQQIGLFAEAEVWKLMNENIFETSNS